MLYNRKMLKFYLQVLGYQPNFIGIMQFQKEHGLLATGILNFATVEKIVCNFHANGKEKR